MKSVASYDALDKFGRIRLSKHFFMRDFLYSEISNFYEIQNLPTNPERAIEAGKKLCEELLEPLNATFGRISVRSAYRSQAVNQFGNENKLNCASNEANYAHHIWDMPDHENKQLGATACICIPWFMDKYNAGADWRSLAYISWHESPKKNITSWMSPRVLLKGAYNEHGFADWYKDFPELVVTK